MVPAPRPIRAGVIGAGSWALAAHIPALAAEPDVELVAVCRKGGDALTRIRDQYGFTVATEDYREVIAQELDVIVVASPSGMHHEHARAALESGAHVLCEKPMTIEPARAWDLVRTANSVDRELLMSFGWNYQAIVRDSVRLLEDNPTGELEQLTIHMSSQTRELLSNTGAYPDAAKDSLPDPATWTDPALSGGGYAQAQLSHAFALALALVPNDVSSAYTLMTAPLGEERVELHDAAVVTFDNGATGTVSGASSHMDAWGNKHELVVRGFGSSGQFVVDLHRELSWVFTAGAGETRLPLPEDAGAYVSEGPARALAEVGRGNRAANTAPGELGARTVDALDLLYRSARTGAVASR